MEAEEILRKIYSSDQITFNDSFSYCKECTELLRDHDTESYGRKIIISILDNWKKVDPATHEIWTDIIESEGFYPYLINDENLVLKQTAGLIRQGMSKSKNLEYHLHDEQLAVKNILDGDQNVILSAPTSFGKSLLIEELVAEGKYDNIVVIQPTLALLDETRKKLKKYDNNYQLIVRTSQQPSDEKGNLFLLTAERVMEYEDLPKIDLLIIDEFYKLSARRDDERSDVLNNAFHLILHRDNARFYLLGPNIDGISEGFAEKYNAYFYKTNYSLVEQIVESRYSKDFGISGQKKVNKENALFSLLLELKEEQTLIYCSSPSRARSLSDSFLLFIQDHIDQSPDDISLIEWIEKNVSEKWGLINCLRHKIAFHDGALQKHITASIIDYFNNGHINFLFCTSTIIEGVNTSAKNIIIYDKHKGKRDKAHIIDYFDYSNIKGRAGRMMVHYTGKVFNFNEEFEKDEELIVDIPFFQQEPIKDEVLLHLDEDEIKNKDSEQYKKIKLLPQEEQELFKKNGVLVFGQKNILEYLRGVITPENKDLLWSNFPEYHQLEIILTLAWNNLIKEGESQFPMSPANLTRVTFNYAINENIFWLVNNENTNLVENRKWAISLEEMFEAFSPQERKEFNKTTDGKRYSRVKRLIKMSDNQIYDEAIRTSFNILRHWFQYKVPKWLRTLHYLQEFVCDEKGIKPGNYLFYADKIESDFVRDNLAILLEYGIPKSAITKLENYIGHDVAEIDVVNLTKSDKLMERAKLLQYEKERIKESL